MKMQIAIAFASIVLQIASTNLPGNSQVITSRKFPGHYECTKVAVQNQYCSILKSTTETIYISPAKRTIN